MSLSSATHITSFLVNLGVLSVLTRLLFRFNTTLTKSPSFLEEVGKLILNFMQKSHGPRICKTLHEW